MRAVIVSISFLAWLFLSYQYYLASLQCEKVSSSITDAVGLLSTTNGSEVEAEKVDYVNSEGPLMTRWGQADIVESDSWPDNRTYIIDFLKDADLEVVGFYQAEERNTTKYENLGIARALASADLLLPEVPRSRIKLSSKLIEGTLDTLTAFESTAFNPIKKNHNVEQLVDRTIIRFPYNSTRKINNREVENYLNRLAKQVQRTDKLIQITGHTDSFGDGPSNKVLGQQRAEIVKASLIQKGVPGFRIRTVSKGESEPVANNKTREGRLKNRRVEIKLINEN